MVSCGLEPGNPSTGDQLEGRSARLAADPIRPRGQRGEAFGSGRPRPEQAFGTQVQEGGGEIPPKPMTARKDGQLFGVRMSERADLDRRAVITGAVAVAAASVAPALPAADVEAWTEVTIGMPPFPVWRVSYCSRTMTHVVRGALPDGTRIFEVFAIDPALRPPRNRV
jgi:hypothetical protein